MTKHSRKARSKKLRTRRLSDLEHKHRNGYRPEDEKSLGEKFEVLKKALAWIAQKDSGPYTPEEARVAAEKALRAVK